MYSTVKRACPPSRALAASVNLPTARASAVDISADGRFVVFAAEAGNLTAASFAPGISHVFLRDRADGTTRLLTVGAGGDPANGPSRSPVIDERRHVGGFRVGRNRSRGSLDGATESSSSASPPGMMTRVDEAADGGIASGREHVTVDERRRPLCGIRLESGPDVHRARPVRRRTMASPTSMCATPGRTPRDGSAAESLRR